MAAELASLPLDAIVLHDTTIIPFMASATTTIPIIMTTSGDPVGDGLIESLARPGRNLTGLTSLAQGATGKRLELLRDAAGATRVAILWDPESPVASRYWRDTEDASAALGIELLSMPVSPPYDLEAAFTAAGAERADALMVFSTPALNRIHKAVAELGLSHRLPTMGLDPGLVEAGGLMCYAPNTEDRFRRAAAYVDRVLKGQQPSTLPVEQPIRFDLHLNLDTSAKLDLAIPSSILSQATSIVRTSGSPGAT